MIHWGKANFDFWFPPEARRNSQQIGGNTVKDKIEDSVSVTCCMQMFLKQDTQSSNIKKKIDALS